MPPGRPSKRVTLVDVAREAGVSRATASLVVRKSPLVSKATAERVELAMRSLGYVYDLGAARMRHARSRTVGVILPNLSNPFFSELLSGIEATLDTAGLVVIIANTRESLTKQATFVQRMREHGVDGLIVCPAANSRSDLLEQPAFRGLPVVQALRHVAPGDSDYAGTDYTDGMRQATEYLVSLGHERIAFVSGNRTHSAYFERLEGFQSTLQKYAIPDDFVLNIPLTHRDGANAAAFLLNRPEPPTAAICFNDVVALGLLRGLHERGVEAGTDFSVIGFDDVPEASLSRPLLTSVSTRPFAIGQASAGLLLKRLVEPSRPFQRFIEPTHLVVRESCMAVSGGRELQPNG